jgi:hypothetical protein
VGYVDVKIKRILMSHIVNANAALMQVLDAARLEAKELEPDVIPIVESVRALGEKIQKAR